MEFQNVKTAAKNFTDRFGESAAAQASRRAEELELAQFKDCAAFWREVAKEIGRASREKAPIAIHH